MYSSSYHQSMYVLFFLPYQILEQLFTPVLFYIQHKLLVNKCYKAPKRIKSKIKVVHTTVFPMSCDTVFQVTVFQQCFEIWQTRHRSSKKKKSDETNVKRITNSQVIRLNHSNKLHSESSKVVTELMSPYWQ